MEDARDAKDALAAAGKVVDDREVLNFFESDMITF
jgi:hypothetical protein